ncbi:MAG: DUF2993 domain-containing protein [Leptolyngbyaceae cyanobacterium T60_A2020_046]|nr:DUF2993 domain-containing protein [Leptolyngbyaceae cyanobacterium T60_A2020_046]
MTEPDAPMPDLESPDSATDSATSAGQGSRLISRLLPPAVRLWLLSRLEHVEALVFQIEGRDRELLSGHIPAIVLSAQKAIYDGIHLSQVAVKASAIHINLSQVIRRKPLRLMAPFPVEGDLRLTEADLNATLQSALLGEGLYDFFERLATANPDATGLQTLLQQFPDKTVEPHYDREATIAGDIVTLRLIPKAGQALPAIALSTGLSVQNGQRLRLTQLRWEVSGSTDLALPNLEGFEVNLGSAVALSQCHIAAGEIVLAGIITVMP